MNLILWKFIVESTWVYLIYVLLVPFKIVFINILDGLCLCYAQAMWNITMQKKAKGGSFCLWYTSYEKKQDKIKCHVNTLIRLVRNTNVLHSLYYYIDNLTGGLKLIMWVASVVAGCSLGKEDKIFKVREIAKSFFQCKENTLLYISCRCRYSREI